MFGTILKIAHDQDITGTMQINTVTFGGETARTTWQQAKQSMTFLKEGDYLLTLLSEPSKGLTGQ